MYARTGAERCTYCGRFISLDLPATNELKATCDHVIARAYGGPDRAENYVPSCRKCNSSKRHRTVAEWLKGKRAPDWAVEEWVCNDAHDPRSRDWYAPD